MHRIVKNVDVLVGFNPRLGLGVKESAVGRKSKLDKCVFFEMIDKAIEAYPNIKVIATTLREVHSAAHHTWSAVAWIDGETFQAPVAELEVLDHVGGGDGFASGFFYGLLTGEEPQEAVNLGWAHGALITTSWEIQRWPTWSRYDHLQRVALPEYNVEC